MLVAWSPAGPGDTSGDSQVSRQLVAPPLVALDLPSWQTAARDSPPVVTSHQELNTVLTTFYRRFVLLGFDVFLVLGPVVTSHQELNPPTNNPFALSS